MHKLDRYIGTSVFLAILSVLGIIVGLALLFAFIDELGDLSDSYGTLEALIYVVLTLPRRAYEMLPMAALIGCLIGLGSLASNSELTIMRAAGVSIGRIVWAVMKPISPAPIRSTPAAAKSSAPQATSSVNRIATAGSSSRAANQPSPTLISSHLTQTGSRVTAGWRT